MRLTLRTLLAYMDDILELEDAQDIAKKIQDSERASELLHRIRDAIQRPRLAAPDVAERGEGLDPNTVAEYLDNTLSADRVLDFEKVCLDSDVHLAEVASCHQILTLVLGEPAEVDPEGRQRMYQIPRSASTSEAAAEANSPTGEQTEQQQAAHELAAVVPREESTIREYPREPRRKQRWGRDLIVAAVSAIAVVAVFYLTGLLEPGTRVGDLVARLQNPPASAPEVTAASGKTSQAGQTTAEQRGAAPAVAGVRQPPGVTAAAAPTAKAGPTAPVAPLPPGAENVELPAAAATKLPAAPLLTLGPRPGAIASSEKEASKKALPPNGLAKTVPAPASPGPDGLAPGKIAASSGQPPAAKPAETGPAETGPAETGPAETGPAETGPAETGRVAPLQAGSRPAGESPPVPQAPAGQYISTTEVLVRQNPQSAAWNRVPAQARLNTHDQILSFPTYRPVVLLDSGLGMQLVDGTRVTLLPADTEGAAGINVHYGRIVLTAKQQNTRIRLAIGDRVSTVRFVDAGSELRLDVSHSSASHVDPQTERVAPVTDSYVTSGKVLWQETANQEPVTIAAPGQFRWEAFPPRVVGIERPPAWDSPDAVNSLDQRASSAMERSLEVERPVVLGLRELADRRQREVRWLALRCLAYVGDFELLAIAMNDPEQRLVWQDYIDQLRAALARGPESATAVRTTMERLYRGDGATLYELLWKYHKRKLEPQEAGQLVQLLDREPLAVRVLSFWNLRENMGFTLFYRPEYPASKRLPLVQKWRERLGINQQTGSDRADATGGGKLPTARPPLE